MKLPLKIALTYFAWANLIFLAGVHRKVDEAVWGFLAFVSYWPFSHVTEWILKLVEGMPPSLDNSHGIFLGLSAAQCLIYALDVVAGTAWWWALSLLVVKAHAQSSGGGTETR